MASVCSKCGKDIGALGNYGTEEQHLCYECAHPETKVQDKPSNKVKSSIAAIFIFVCVLLFLGFFHVVTDNFAIIPKEHFTFSMTLVKVSDIIDQYNNQSLADRMKTDVLFDHLVKQLENRKMIVSSTSKEVPADITNDNAQSESENSPVEPSQNSAPENENNIAKDSPSDTDKLPEAPLATKRPGWTASDSNPDTIGIDRNVIYDKDSVDEKPVPIKKIQPFYPEFVKDQGISGIVKTSLVIDQNGKVSDINVISSPNEALSDEVRKAIARWEYKPGRIKGVPVKVQTTVEISFQLE